MASIDFGVCPAMYSRSSHVGSESRACDCDLRERFLAIALHFAPDQRQPAWVLWGPSVIRRYRPWRGHHCDRPQVDFSISASRSESRQVLNPGTQIRPHRLRRSQMGVSGYRMEFGDERACRKAGRLMAHRRCGERIARSFCTLYRGEVGFRFLPDQRRPAWLH